MSTPYNPGSSTTNCGFCAIAHGLFVQQGVRVTADELCERTLTRLGLTRQGGRDPLPRMLIFPDAMLDSVPPSAEYSALQGRAHGLSSYTITSVAQDWGLRFTAGIRDLDLPRQFFEFSANLTGDWTLDSFVQQRREFLEERGRTPNLEALQRHIADALGGHSILGSKTSNHYINAHIDPCGHVTAYDAQDGSFYDGRGLKRRLRSVDLFIHLLP